MKKLCTVLLITCLSLSLISCTNGATPVPSATEEAVPTEAAATPEDPATSEEAPPADQTIPGVPAPQAGVYPSGDVMFEAPKAGDTVATLKTTMGDIKIRFFPDYVPKTVENFLTLAGQDYYDGITFHRVINDFMIQGGDPTGTGAGGESAFDGEFEDEFAFELRNVRGAVSMANAGPGTNSSQFFIVQNTALDPNSAAMMEAYNAEPKMSLGEFNGAEVTADMIFPERIVDYYLENGGTPNLDFTSMYYFGGQSAHAVFGFVIEGMDVVDAIAAVETGANDKPVTDVVIEDVVIETVQ